MKINNKFTSAVRKGVRKGFTLVEIMTAAAIGAIIAAVVGTLVMGALKAHRLEGGQQNAAAMTSFIANVQGTCTAANAAPITNAITANSVANLIAAGTAGIPSKGGTLILAQPGGAPTDANYTMTTANGVTTITFNGSATNDLAP